MIIGREDTLCRQQQQQITPAVAYSMGPTPKGRNHSADHNITQNHVCETLNCCVIEVSRTMREGETFAGIEPIMADFTRVMKWRICRPYLIVTAS